MSNKFNDASQTLERMAVKYEALMQAAAALKEIGSLEQAAAEQQAAANAAKLAAEQARADLANLVEEIEQGKSRQAAKIKETDEIAATAIFNANEQATAILSRAEQEAAQLKADAGAQGRAEASHATREIATLNSTKANLTSEISVLQERARAAGAEADDAENRLAKVKEQIAKLAAG